MCAFSLYSEQPLGCNRSKRKTRANLWDRIPCLLAAAVPPGRPSPMLAQDGSGGRRALIEAGEKGEVAAADISLQEGILPPQALS